MTSGAKEPKNGGIAYVTKAYAFPAPLVKLGALVGLRNFVLHLWNGEVGGPS